MILKIKKYLPYVLGVLCVVLMFGFEFLDDHSSEYIKAKSEYQLSIDSVSAALVRVKNIAKGTPEYSAYLLAVENKNKAKPVFYKVKEAEVFFGFKTKKIFWASFGPMFCVFLYVLYMMFRSCYFDKKNIGVKVLNSLVLGGVLFYLLWIFHPFEDLSNVSYYFMTIVCSIFIVIAIHYITKFNEHTRNKLKNQNLALAKLKINSASDEEKEEVLDEIERIVKQE
ncbi:hypothetical protein MHM83_11105 [Tenacibaculum sp. Mcav3-52]|uniref:hypothetical protein n=1 Tax=Tenacibaculum sp. Mcav3-52 TaxID=2917762 RepID=UPI001EF1E4F4|nr:hypothetical protein [Tenacibaculum sp. Mcav3-52]MCG7502421.1 hypothetical protein [Tenacibaculum sp. Mcav3-52]